MKQLSNIVILYFLLAFTGCGSDEKKLTEKDIKAMADSTFNARRGEIDKAATEDLEQRKTIEVKAIADSIVYARQYGVKQPATPPPIPSEEMGPPDSLRQRMKRHRDSLRSRDSQQPIQRAASKQLMPANR